ncbi:DUF3472 domain-containing protein [Anatilimnocola floriformis]|uniref:DUF3472 domain-containing protein n=1 Tax=Anatilimnocola floriformis TaxID=2948575 RepID=UPI0020C23B78|nr:DUF3472 domain-containing protein [Anatilimnocola floriformis]
MKRPASLFVLLACLVVAASAIADEKLAGVACRSVHWQWRGAAGTAFYNEVIVDQSAPGTYFCVCGFNHGYFGIQQLDDKRKVAIFSVWDPGKQNDPTKVDENNRVKLLYNDDAVRVKRFGNEGTGGQSFLDLDWKVGETYRLMVTCERKDDRTAYTGWIYMNEAKEWKKLVTFSTLTKDEKLGGYYSFVEDFRRNKVSATQPRMARFGNGWVLVDGKWQAIERGRFTADNNPAKTINAGLKEQLFFLATGGETANSDLELSKSIDLPVADRQPPADVAKLLASPAEPAQPAK